MSHLRGMRRLLSWVWPIRKDAIVGRHGVIEARWEYGRLVLNSARANQSLGSLHRVWQAVFARIGLQRRPPQRVLLLGLGAGSVPRILRKELKLACAITAIEIDPAMLAFARRHFGLGSLTGLEVIEADATIAIHGMRDRFDLVVVDLFEDIDLARGADTLGFAQALHERCSRLVLFNTLIHDSQSKARSDRVRANLQAIFHSVDEMRLEGVNRVFIAACGPLKSC